MKSWHWYQMSVGCWLFHGCSYLFNASEEVVRILVELFLRAASLDVIWLSFIFELKEIEIQKWKFGHYKLPFKVWRLFIYFLQKIELNRIMQIPLFFFFIVESFYSVILQKIVINLHLCTELHTS